MKVIEHIDKADKTLFSFEVLPPLKGHNFKVLSNNIEPLMEFDPPFIDVTYHREEYVYKNRGAGLLERKTTRKRPGTVGICAAIKNKFNVDTVPHIICGGFSKEETENALIDLDFLGIENVLALQGDAIKTESRFVAEEDGHKHASELLQQTKAMNEGRYLDEELENASHTDFCVGVAGYPEKHFAAPNLKIDLKYLKNKVDMGADYIVTQMFFDNQKYFDFVNNCRKEGIDVPIIPGLKPITTGGQITVLPQSFHIDIPEELADAVESCKNNTQVRQVGIQWAVQQSRELMEFGVPVLHYYSMGRSDVVYNIAKELF